MGAVADAIMVISIHVPAWGTTSGADGDFGANTISIHVPAWGTTQTGLALASPRSNFNPRSRVGNDIKGDIYGSVIYISIHVPAWGTTSIHCSYKSLSIISIHVPAWGTTAVTSPQYLPLNDFNPRSRVGND